MAKNASCKNGAGDIVKPEKQYWVVKRDKVAVAEPIPEIIDPEPVLDGYGYYGVLLTNSDGSKVMCHLCGKWYVALNVHSLQTHGIEADDYKVEFELGKIGLAAPEYSRRMRQRAINSRLADKIKNPVDITEFRPNQKDQRSLRGRLISSAIQNSESTKQASREGQLRRWADPKKRAKGRAHLDRVRSSAGKALKGKPKGKTCRANMSRAAKARYQPLVAQTTSEIMAVLPGTIKEIATITGKPKRTVHNYLKRMVEQGKVERRQKDIPLSNPPHVYFRRDTE